MQTSKAGPERDTPLLRELRSFPGGERVADCDACGECAEDCPNASLLQVPPHELVAAVLEGREGALLDRDALYRCGFCFRCALQCDKGVPVADVVYMLRREAMQQALGEADRKTADYARAFNDNVRKHGRHGGRVRETAEFRAIVAKAQELEKRP